MGQAEELAFREEVILLTFCNPFWKEIFQYVFYRAVPPEV